MALENEFKMFESATGPGPLVRCYEMKEGRKHVVHAFISNAAAERMCGVPKGFTTHTQLVMDNVDLFKPFIIAKWEHGPRQEYAPHAAAGVVNAEIVPMIVITEQDLASGGSRAA